MEVTVNSHQVQRPAAMIWTEGKTDWKHLKKAIQELKPTLQIAFQEHEGKSLGDTELLRKCKTLAETEQLIPQIFVFDRDNEAVVAEVIDKQSNYKDWGNRVYSLALPIPLHRAGASSTCIEFYYSDADLLTADQHGRRLFLSTEFNAKSGTHLNDPQIHVGDKGRLAPRGSVADARIIDADVFKGNESIALSKADFARHVLQASPPFDSFGFDAFLPVLDIFEHIVKIDSRVYDIFYGGQSLSQTAIKGKASGNESCMATLTQTYSVIRMALTVFVAATVRFYEEAITAEPDKYAKKARDIKRTISESFTEPGFFTLLELARHCFFLIDSSAPRGLHRMKSCLDTVIELGPIGIVLDDLNAILPRGDVGSSKVIWARQRRDLLKVVLPELTRYEGKLEELKEILVQEGDQVNWNPQTWELALVAIQDALGSILTPTNAYVLRILKHVDTVSGSYHVLRRNYKDLRVVDEELALRYEEYESYQRDILELVLDQQDGEQMELDLFPFLIMRDDRLLYYRKTRAAGFEYQSALDNRVALLDTRRKFNHALFGIPTYADSQALFWTGVAPNENPVTGVRANIPIQDFDKFIGRRRQIKKIKEEIIDIPNRDGIVYGPGGVGKTSLMIQLSRMLFEMPAGEEAQFKNIIWVSAKRDYYNPLLNTMVKRKRQFETLKDVLLTILYFFNYTDTEEYLAEDLKRLVLDLLEENRVLLILDNMEALRRDESDDIRDFFDLEVKKRLRRKPDYFKMVLTSRKQVPSGLHQIRLSGLDQPESKQLINSLYARYQNSKPALTDEQKIAIHEASGGIPIVIKHCVGQIYEYDQPLQVILKRLHEVSSEIVQFSFSEVLDLLKQDPSALRILILLEIVRGPLLIRQIADVLQLPEEEVEQKVPVLEGFQCIDRVAQGWFEKYRINDEVRFLTRGLAVENSGIVQEIRKQLAINFSIDKQMDYTSSELGILLIFNNYLSEEQFLEAQDYIREQLAEWPDSILLNLSYARFLQEHLRDFVQAIKILEDIRQRSHNHPSILRLLISCFISLDVPNYQAASVFASDLEATSPDSTVKLELAEFYVQWSTSIKIRAPHLDPIKEMLRQGEYKRLADKALAILKEVPADTDQVCYLLGQCYFNKWDYQSAVEWINKAFDLVDAASTRRANYWRFRGAIIAKAREFGFTLNEHLGSKRYPQDDYW